MNYKYRSIDLIWILPIILSLIALFNLPYGYYHFLRLIVCPSAFLIAYQHKKNKLGLEWFFAFFLIGMLFNPVFTVHLTKDIWSIIDVVTAIFYAVNFYLYRDKFRNVL